MDTRYDFPVTPDYPVEDLRRVQARLLEMATATSDILKEAGIWHSLAMGSLLGAVRHKGFIPWDDDFDFWVEDARYEEALALLHEKLPDDMIVHDEQNDPIYWPKWSRVRDLRSNTVLSQYANDNLYRYKGICIDMYRLYVIDSDDLARNWLRMRYDNVMAKFDRGVLTADDLERYFNWIHDLYQTWFVNYDARFHGTIVTDNFGWELSEYDDFFPAGEIEFEGIMFPAPNNPYPFLDSMFQDAWRDPPPYEKRISHISKVEWL